jgi:hypothetical protein
VRDEQLERLQAEGGRSAVFLEQRPRQRGIVTLDGGRGHHRKYLPCGPEHASR